MINKNFDDWQAVYYDRMHVTMWQSTFLWCVTQQNLKLKVGKLAHSMTLGRTLNG